MAPSPPARTCWQPALKALVCVDHGFQLCIAQLATGYVVLYREGYRGAQGGVQDIGAPYWAGMGVHDRGSKEE